MLGIFHLLEKLRIFAHHIMIRFLKFIGILMLAWLFGQVAGGTFTDVNAVNEADGMNLQERVAAHQVPSAEHQAAAASFTAPRLPYLPDAELASSGGASQCLISSRVQRTQLTEYLFLLKDRVEQLSRREAALSLHRERFFDAAVFFPFCPVCEYYVFTLRRLLI